MTTIAKCWRKDFASRPGIRGLRPKMVELLKAAYYVGFATGAVTVQKATPTKTIALLLEFQRFVDSRFPEEPK